MRLDPTKDGITHINIYSKGKTELGRLLTNFSKVPVCLNEGRFQSIEGYWYWLGTRDQRLRDLSGFEAKKLGKELQVIHHVSDFEEKIKEALWEKAFQHKTLRSLLIKSTLPFTHYYVYDGKVVGAGYEWITEEWEKIRAEFKDRTRCDC